MSCEIRRKDSGMRGFYKASFALLLAFWLSAAAFGQTNTQVAATNASEKSAAVITPVLTNYREIKIGTTADEVRERFGKAKIDDKDGFFYQFSDDEFAQIRLDKDKKVRLISITYSGENKNAPKYADVFGADAEAAAKPDGSIYKLVRYPDAGYWVAYSRAAGENPTVTVTMQKMRVRK